MKNVILLLKLYIKQFIGSFKRSNNKSSQASGYIFAMLIGLLFIFLFTSMGISTVSEAIKVDMPELAIYIQGATCLMFAMLIVVLKCTKIKRSNDADLLLSLPFKKSEIIFARTLSNIVIDFFTIVVTIVPGFVVYYVMVPGTSFMIIVWSLIISILLTILATGLSLLLKHLIYQITKNMKNAEIFQTVISTIFTIAFFVVYFLINQSMYNIDTGVENIFYSFEPLKWIVDLSLKNNLLYLLYIALCSIIPFIIAIIIETRIYGKEVSYYKTTNNKLKFEQHKPFAMLYKKEMMSYLKTPIYVINTIIGGLLLLLTSGLLYAVGPEYVINLFKGFHMEFDRQALGVIVVLLLTLIASTIVTTSSAISLEGKYFWILKVNPIKEKYIFSSKIFVNITIGIIPIILSGVLASLAIGFEYLPFLIIIPFLMLCFSAIMGLFINIKYPKLDWNDESEPIKKGVATLLGFFVGSIPSIIFFILYITVFIKIINPYIYLAIICGIELILVFVAFELLNTKGKKLFKNI